MLDVGLRSDLNGRRKQSCNLFTQRPLSHVREKQSSHRHAFCETNEATDNQQSHSHNSHCTHLSIHYISSLVLTGNCATPPQHPPWGGYWAFDTPPRRPPPPRGVLDTPLGGVVQQKAYKGLQNLAKGRKSSQKVYKKLENARKSLQKPSKVCKRK